MYIYRYRYTYFFRFYICIYMYICLYVYIDMYVYLYIYRERARERKKERERYGDSVHLEGEQIEGRSVAAPRPAHVRHLRHTLAHKKQPPPQGPPKDPSHRPFGRVLCLLSKILLYLPGLSRSPHAQDTYPRESREAPTGDPLLGRRCFSWAQQAGKRIGSWKGYARG